MSAGKLMKTETKHDWVETLRGIGKIRTIPSSEAFFFQGETLTTIGLIISGTAQAVVHSEDGQETWVGEFGPDEFFGHSAILGEGGLDMTITATTELRFLSIAISKFNAALANESALSTALAQDLARRLHFMTQRLVEAITLTSPGRVCAELMRLSKPIGIEPKKSIVRPNPVFTQLASRISSTRETVSRTVSSLQKKGIISREPGAILIHKPDALRKQIK